MNKKIVTGLVVFILFALPFSLPVKASQPQTQVQTHSSLLTLIVVLTPILLCLLAVIMSILCGGFGIVVSGVSCIIGILLFAVCCVLGLLIMGIFAIIFAVLVLIGGAISLIQCPVILPLTICIDAIPFIVSWVVAIIWGIICGIGAVVFGIGMIWGIPAIIIFGILSSIWGIGCVWLNWVPCVGPPLFMVVFEPLTMMTIASIASIGFDPILPGALFAIVVGVIWGIVSIFIPIVLPCLPCAVFLIITLIIDLIYWVLGIVVVSIYAVLGLVINVINWAIVIPSICVGCCSIPILSIVKVGNPTICLVCVEWLLDYIRDLLKVILE